MTGLEKVGMGCTDGSNQNGDGLAMKGSLGLSECSWFPACEQTAGEGPSLCGLFLPGGFFPCSSLVKLKDLTLICWSVLFPWRSVDNLSISDELAGLSQLWGELSRAAAQPAPGSLGLALYCLDLRYPVVCFSLSIRPNRVKLGRATLGHESQTETYKIIFTCNLGQDLFLKPAVNRNRMLKAKPMEWEAKTVPFSSKPVIPVACAALGRPEFLVTSPNTHSQDLKNKALLVGFYLFVFS